MLYPIARQTPVSNLVKVDVSVLEMVKKRLNQSGIEAEIFL
jgi:hypothetical protein